MNVLEKAPHTTLEEKVEKPKNWGDTTNPQAHDPGNFRYLVHLVTGGAGPNFSVHSLPHPLDLLKPASDSQSVDSIKRLERISTTLIDPTHTATFVVGRWGYIVEADPDEVIATSSRDIGADAFLLSEHELREKYGVLPPEEILDRSEAYHHNEVLVRGGRVNVAGVFYLNSEFPDRGPANFDQDLYEIEKVAATNSLPIVAI